MKYRLLIWILWPSFLVAGMEEGLLFTIVHPQDLLFLAIIQIFLMRESIPLDFLLFGFFALHLVHLRLISCLVLSRQIAKM